MRFVTDTHAEVLSEMWKGTAPSEKIRLLRIAPPLVSSLQISCSSLQFRIMQSARMLLRTCGRVSRIGESGTPSVSSEQQVLAVLRSTATWRATAAGTVSPFLFATPQASSISFVVLFKGHHEVYSFQFWNNTQ